MKRMLLAAAVCFAFSIGALARQPRQSPASQPASAQDVQRFFDAIHENQLISKMMDAMSGSIRGMIHQEFTRNQQPCSLPPDFETHLVSVMEDSMKSMPWDQMIRAMVPIYQKHFTEADINALIAFYSTPTGQKFLNETPAVMAESMQALTPLLMQQTGQMQKRIQDEMENAMKQSKNKACQGAAGGQK